MLVQPIEDEGEGSERPSEQQPILSLSLTHHLDLHPLYLLQILFLRILVEILEVTAQAAEIKSLKAQYLQTLNGKTDKVDEKGESIAQQQSTDRQDEGTDILKVSTDRTKLSTDKVEEGTAEPEPRVEIRNAKNVERPRTTLPRSILTLKPLPKIDPNDKGKKRIEEDEESNIESEEITEAKKKFDQIAHNEEVAKKCKRNGKLKKREKG
ncbi:hypothetical protein Tco_1373646 [Tanacetum coccineum]